MIIFPADIPSGEIDADVAIFGAGPAGISMARRLAKAGRKIVLVESGGYHLDPKLQSLFHGKSVGEKMHPEEGRYRILGGASTHWTGRCAKLDPIDFEKREWMPCSGWPISYDDLAPYYSNAAAACGFPADWETIPSWYKAISPVPSGKDVVEPFLWRFFKTRSNGYRDFGLEHLAELRNSDQIMLLLQADLVGIQPTSDQTGIAAAILRDGDKRDVRVTARRFVLTCGGIENTRLLLNFAEDHPMLFGSVSHTIGRRFMQHPRTVAAQIKTRGTQSVKLQNSFNNFGRIGVHYESGFALSAKAQRTQGLVNASAVLRYSTTIPRVARELITRPAQTVNALRKRAQGQTGSFANVKVSLNVDLEQVPDPDSRLHLESSRDFLGLRKIVVDWRISPIERRTSAVFTRAICEWINQSGLGKPQYSEDLDSTGGLTASQMLESYHHIGGTRMAADPATGVVDRDLKVFGIDNLYISGASVMPTGGHANPTLTILALSLRLANHLDDLF